MRQSFTSTRSSVTTRCLASSSSTASWPTRPIGVGRKADAQLPAPDVEHLLERTAAFCEQRGARLVLIGWISERDSAEHDAGVRYPELTHDVLLATADPEIPRPKALLDGGQQDQHDGHRRVHGPERDRPVFLLVQPELDLVGLRVTIQVQALVGERQNNAGRRDAGL